LKYLFYFILSLTLFFTINTKNNAQKLTQVILSIPNLSNEDVSLHLKNEFKNLSDIDYIEGSIISNTIVLQVDEHSFNKTKIEKMLNKWGLDVEEYAFINLSSSTNFE